MADFFAGLGGGIYTVFNMGWAALSGIRLVDILDIAVVARCYLSAKESGKGIVLPFWE